LAVLLLVSRWSFAGAGLFIFLVLAVSLFLGRSRQKGPEMLAVSQFSGRSKQFVSFCAAIKYLISGKLFSIFVETCPVKRQVTLF
jgi:hypothetical protein